jgi:hypothetical protein
MIDCESKSLSTGVPYDPGIIALDWSREFTEMPIRHTRLITKNITGNTKEKKIDVLVKCIIQNWVSFMYVYDH